MKPFLEWPVISTATLEMAFSSPFSSLTRFVSSIVMALGYLSVIGSSSAPIGMLSMANVVLLLPKFQIRTINFMARFWTTVLYKTVHSTPVRILQLNIAPIAYFTGVGDPKKGIKNRAKMLQKNKKRT